MHAQADPVTVRSMAAVDVKRCGKILFTAFHTLATRHNVTPDFLSVDAATECLTSYISQPGVLGLVAEQGHDIVGSVLLDTRSRVAAIGAISVNPEAQGRSTGRRLMQACIEGAHAAGLPDVRLCQQAHNTASLSLYTKLGFVVREALALLQGPALHLAMDGYHVRGAGLEDVQACNRLHTAVHGYEREGELVRAIAGGHAQVVEHLGRITGYTSGVAFFGYSVGETNADLQVLIGAAREFGGLGFHVPARNYQLLTWCLQKGLRVVMQETYMTIGMYNEPQGAYLPSIFY